MSTNSFLRWYAQYRGSAKLDPQFSANEAVLLVIGNSLAANSFAPTYVAGGAKITQFTDRGWMNWLFRTTKTPILRLYHAGVGGITVPELAENFEADVLNATKAAGNTWFVMGGNEGINGVSIRADSIPLLVDMIQKCTNLGIKCLVSIDWGPHSGAPVLQAEINLFQRYMQVWCERNGASYIDIVQPMVRAKAEPFFTGISWTRSSTSLVISKVGHGYIVDDFVHCSNFGNIATGVYRVTVINTADQFTVSVSNSGDVSGAVGVIRRTHIRNGFTNDGLHTEMRGSSVIAANRRDLFSVWPPLNSPLLATQGMDYMNILGAGMAVAPDLVSTGIPAFTATAGTAQGTLPLPSGVIATGWFVRSLVGGNAAATVVCASAVRAVPMEHITEQSVVATNAATGSVNCAVQTNIDTPAVSRANSVPISKGDWRLGLAGSGRLWLCCVIGGTTLSTAPGALLVPLTEALTPIGTQIVDGTVTWEVRLGHEAGDVLVLVGEAVLSAAAELGAAIAAGNYTSACNSLTAGIHQSATGATAGDIVDMVHGSNANGPYLRVGDTFTIRTPEFAVPAAASSICGFRFGVTAGLNTSVTFKFTNAAVINLTYLGLA